jgi:hypothetical protein
MDPRRPRKGKPLLLATAGLATISFVACSEPRAPVGNLRPPDNPPPDYPVGNLRAPDEVDAGTPLPPDDAGAGATDEPPGPPPINPPVGNMRRPDHTDSR